MTKIYAPTPHQSGLGDTLPLLVLAGSIFSQYSGAAWAKTLFPLVGADGVTAVRLGLSALLLMLALRSWKNIPRGSQLAGILLYGAALGAMNLCIYRAMQLIPIGIAVAIEATGPLAVALFGARRLRDFLWIALAVMGLLLLLPLEAADGKSDPAGYLWAMAAAASWAAYIVFGKRVSGLPTRQAVSWGMMTAALLVVPIGVANAGTALLQPKVLLAGLFVAFLSSIIPYLLEMWTLRRVPARVFGLLISGSPAVAALCGVVLLGERLDWMQWAGIMAIVCASVGTCLFKGRQRTAS